MFPFSLFLEHAPSARRAAPRGWWPCYFIIFDLSLFLQQALGARRAARRGWWPYYLI
jgi:hypothetical protein